MAHSAFAFKLWLGGFVILYGAAKIHTFVTMDSGHFLERHWPFWAAMALWGAALALGQLVAEWRRRSANGRSGQAS